MATLDLPATSTLTSPLRKHWERVVWWSALALGLTLFVLVRTVNGDDRFAYGWDEGFYLSVARLMVNGYPLYNAIFYPAAPGYVYALAGAFELFGTSVLLGRAVTMFFALIGLAATYRLGAMLGGRAGGLLAAILLAISPGYFLYAWAIYTDLPSLALALLALALGLDSLALRDRRRLAIAGFVWSLAFLFKPLVVTLALPIALWIVVNRWAEFKNDWRGFGRALALDALWFGAAAALPLVILLLIHGWAMFDQVFSVQSKVREQLTGRLSDDATRIWNFLMRDTGLMILGTFGAIALILKRPALVGGLVVGWIATLLLQFQATISYHHLVMLLPIPAALAGGLLSAATEAVSSRRYREWFNRAVIVLALGGSLAYVYAFGRVLNFDRATVTPEPARKSELGAVQWLKTRTDADEFILSDDPMIAFRAERNLPPPVAGPSRALIAISSLNSEQLATVAQAYDVRVIVVWERFKELPEWIEWLEGRYGATAIFQDGARTTHTIYVRMQ